jgi:hypothetical protein
MTVVGRGKWLWHRKRDGGRDSLTCVGVVLWTGDSSRLLPGSAPAAVAGGDRCRRSGRWCGGCRRTWPGACSRCSGCGRVSTRVHSRYRRRVADLPVSGRPVVLWLTVRRFFCDHIDCRAVTFVEQVTGLTDRRARRSAGLQGALAAIGVLAAASACRARWRRSGWHWLGGPDPGWPPSWAWR